MISFIAYSARKKENLTPLYARKKILPPEVWEKILSQTKSPISPTPPEVKWSSTNFSDHLFNSYIPEPKNNHDNP